MIYVKLHDTENGVILAMCDQALIDRVIEEGEVYLNVRDYSEFYKGELLEGADAQTLISKEGLHSASIVGEEAVAVAIRKGIVKRSHVKVAAGVKYANAYRLG